MDQTIGRPPCFFGAAGKFVSVAAVLRIRLTEEMQFVCRQKNDRNKWLPQGGIKNNLQDIQMILNR